MRGITRVSKAIWGFGKMDKSKLIQDSISEDELIKILSKLETNQNWLVRGFWLLAAALIGTNVLG